MVSGPLALRLTRLSREDLCKLDAIKIECSFRKQERKARATKTRSSKDVNSRSKAKRSVEGKAKRKRDTSSSENEGDGDDEDDIDEGSFIVYDADQGDEWNQTRRSPRVSGLAEPEESDDVDQSQGWMYRQRPDPPPPKKRRIINKAEATGGTSIVMEGDNEVLILSSD